MAGGARKLVAAVTLCLLAACGARTGLFAPASMQEPDRACVALDAAADLAPLDVFITMDTSRSMAFVTSAGVTKADAVASAVQQFVNDPASEGIRVALGFFPQLDQDLPSNCRDDFDCGEPDTCEPKLGCVPDGASIACEVDADCDAAGAIDNTCRQLGVCSSDNGLICFNFGNGCDGGNGTCVPAGTCNNRLSCAYPDYEDFEVPLGALPQNGAALVQAIATRHLDGPTPTLPALQGVVVQAVARVDQNPSHKVVVLLATDGLPTDCDPGDSLPDAIDNLSLVAHAAAEYGIEVFVIGVFTSAEQSEAQPNLDLIAAAGGSGSALQVTTGLSTADDFLGALEIVRSAKSCDLAVPSADDDVDFETAFAVAAPSDGVPALVERVSSPGQCDAVSGGFYFDVPPESGAVPNRFTLCPATCGLFSTNEQRNVKLVTDCPQP